MIRKTGLALSLSIFCLVSVAQAEDKAPISPKAIPQVTSSKSADYQALKAAREARIAALKEYVKTGKFPWGKKGRKTIGKEDPHYDVKHVQSHRFRGPNGALCALAHLIWQSGDQELVTKIEKHDNHYCLGKDKNAAVEAWVLSSGLTKEECLAIQEPGFVMRRRKLEPIKPALLAELEEQGQRILIRKHLSKVISMLEKNSEKSLRKAHVTLMKSKSKQNIRTKHTG